jgi:hypothetical protein
MYRWGENTMKKFTFLLTIIAIAMSSQAAPSPDVHKVINCTFNKNRIVIYEYSETTSKAEMEAYLEEKPPKNTVGGFTAAYFFKKGSTVPRSGQTLCESISKANEILYESNQISAWNFAYMHDVGGDTVVVDCTSERHTDLCR